MCIVGGPRIRADHVEQWYIADPDGYIVELICQLDADAADRRRHELAESGEGVPVAPVLNPSWGGRRLRAEDLCRVPAAIRALDRADPEQAIAAVQDVRAVPARSHPAANHG